ncbi:hypothetical protein CAPTEDRAFT_229397 [Capitella teleta]|uniref:Uncharacterized protein n=1 Tax=Capitella teleta TaxID=283909 RepID=R7VH75_CAPTE|nr:hypothetical protein CAPTEDRAFT_229397 [Capitella teleta]|eukprot:ELU18163.1 hypothetical protein CAPTEDRAFT_229397 [Capitella teleta]
MARKKKKIDKKGMKKGLDHGVYLSRNNPLGCFTTKKVRPSKDLSKRAEKANEDPSKADIPFKSPENPPPSPRSSACTWDDNILVQVDIPPDDNRKENKNTFVVLSESLNVKGSKMLSRPRSASAAHSPLSQLKIKPRPKSAYPAIVIEGGRKFCFESDHADVTDAEVENGGKKKEEEKEEGKEDQVLRKIDVRVDFFVTEKSHDSERENGEVDVIIPPNQ